MSELAAWTWKALCTSKLQHSLAFQHAHYEILKYQQSTSKVHVKVLQSLVVHWWLRLMKESCWVDKGLLLMPTLAAAWLMLSGLAALAYKFVGVPGSF